jgi:hypothetical protein
MALAHGPSRAQKAAGGTPKAVLDNAFGDGGRVILPAEIGAYEAIGAATADGGILVSGGRGLRLLSGSGQTVSSFGNGGVLLPPSPKRGRFFLGGFAADGRGRILVAGTSLYGVEGTPPEPVPAAARIMRFLPNGRLDRSFGRGGVIETTFGLPPPHDEAGLPILPAPSVQASGIAIGPGGGIVITGSAAVGVGPACVHDVFSPIEESAPFVAELKRNGSPDLSFGQDGVFGGRKVDEKPLRASAIGAPVVSPNGVITYRSTEISACPEKHGRYGLAQLTPNGRPRKALGRREAVGGYFTALAGEPDGSVVAVARLPWSGRQPFKVRFVRIGVNGKVDRSFGDQGQTVVKIGSDGFSQPDALAVDHEGRILLGGTLETHEDRSAFLLRLASDGRQEMDFGPNGRVATPLSNLAESAPSSLFLDSRGRAVTVHRYAPPARRSGLVVARYLLRN